MMPGRGGRRQEKTAERFDCAAPVDTIVATSLARASPMIDFFRVFQSPQ